jgi:N-acylneuraminate cytidylyltransferase
VTRDAPIVAVITARGGRKRIHRKNTRSFCGVLVMVRTLETVVASSLFDDVFVSSEDDEILALAAATAGVTPLPRDAGLADDMTPFVDVMAAVTAQLKDHIAPESVVVGVLPTSPFLTSGDLQAVTMELATGRWSHVFLAARLSVPVERTFSRSPRGGCVMNNPAHFRTRSQDLPIAFRDAETAYAAASSTWQRRETVSDARSTFVEIPAWRALDLDTEEDWEHAEIIYRALSLP